jgi:Tol biopolymer transport system component
MRKASSIGWLLLLALGISGCTYETSPAGPVSSPTATAEAIAKPTAVVAAGQPTASLPAGQPTAISTEPGTNQPSTPQETEIPVTWADLNVKGRLVYMIGGVDYDKFTVDIQILDLLSGRVTTVFSPPPNTWIYYATVSPDGKQLAISYSVPSQTVVPSHASVYTMPLDGSQPPKLLFEPPTKNDQDVQVEWSPDGKYIYYTEVNYNIPPEPNQFYPVYRIYRRALPEGQPELVAEKAYWPRLSGDSSRLVYVFVDPFSLTNQLYVADADGRNARMVEISGSSVSYTKDAPLFAPDRRSIMFSASDPFPADKPNWIETLLGIRTAKADGSIPSDWWSVPEAGGEMTQLTHLQTLALYGSVAPDNKHVASFSASGIFVMNPDGSSVTILVPSVGGIAGTLAWLP